MQITANDPSRKSWLQVSKKKRFSNTKYTLWCIYNQRRYYNNWDKNWGIRY